jgi:hypothetical protein
MSDHESAPEWVTLTNPANGLPWECPGDQESLDYYIKEKGFKKAATASKKEAS